MKRPVWIVIVLLSCLLITSCGGGDGGTSTGGTGLSLSGVVYDASTATAVPVAGVTVKVCDTSGAVLTTTTSASDGAYELTNVPAATDIYIKTSKAGYASLNTEIYNFTTDMLGDLLIVDANGAKLTADAFYGGVGGNSWEDSFYKGASWLCMDIVNNLDSDIPGISVSAAPSDLTIKYNNGSDVYSTTASTMSSIDQPLVGGYTSSVGVYTLSLTNTTAPAIKFPLVRGEITYTVVQTNFTVTGTPTNESSEIQPDVPTIGQVATRGVSGYWATGLTLDNHTVTIANTDSGAAELHVYSDNTYSMELDCTLGSPGALTCTVPDTTALYFRVTCGPLNRDGAWYVIIVH